MFYFICTILGWVELFQTAFSKLGLAVGCRALSLSLWQMGCPGYLASGIGLAVRGILEDTQVFMDNAGPSSGTSSNPGNPSVPIVVEVVDEDENEVWKAVEAEEDKEKKLMLSKEWKESERHLLKVEDLKKTIGQRAKEIAEQRGLNPGRCEAVEDAAKHMAEDVEDLPTKKQVRFLVNLMRDLNNPNSELWERIEEEVKRWRSWE